jgi:hypothetical protein
MLIYSLNSSDYEPISFGDNYLYLQYDKIFSFLLRNYQESYRNILAKPVLNNGVIQWYAEHNQELSRIGDLSESVQKNIKRQYWNLKELLNTDIEELESSKNEEKRKWGNMLRQVFDDENNIILTDGKFWCLLWGWKFKNKTENFLAPEFFNPEPETSLQKVNNDLEISSVDSLEDKPQIEDAVYEDVDLKKPEVEQQVNKPIEKPKNLFWYKIKRFFRNFVYRYWGLMLLFLLLLFIFCLFQKCNRRECKPAYEIEQKLNEIENKVKDRCK